MYNGYASGTSSSEVRRTATAHSRQPPQLPPLAQVSALDMDASAAAQAEHRRRNPDWADFYKNGIPKEVIVIDDDEEPAPPPPRQPAPAPARTATIGSVRHTDKKRKTTASTAYDPVYNQQTSYSTTQTPYYDSPNHSLSTDRTTSALNTTAPTSLGSQVSNGHHISPLDNSAVGQKRKRTRAVVQDEVKQAKRRELDHDDNPFSLYQPPPNPIIKAKDVYVQVVTDVGLLSPLHTSPHANTYQKSYTKDQKVDDEDGHYIVVPEADLTERCKCIMVSFLNALADFLHRSNHKTARPGHVWQGCPGLRSTEGNQLRHQGYSISTQIPRC